MKILLLAIVVFSLGWGCDSAQRDETDSLGLPKMPGEDETFSTPVFPGEETSESKGKNEQSLGDEKSAPAADNSASETRFAAADAGSSDLPPEAAHHPVEAGANEVPGPPEPVMSEPAQTAPEPAQIAPEPAEIAPEPTMSEPAQTAPESAVRANGEQPVASPNGKESESPIVQTPTPLIMANEERAIAILRKLRLAELQFRQQVVVDQDGDGRGEFGFLPELAGTVEVRGGGWLNPPLIESSYGESAMRYGGVAISDGYCFCCYLPGVKVAMVGSGNELKPLADAVTDVSHAIAVDWQENNFLIYAWPVEPGQTGIRAFAISRSAGITACSQHNYSRAKRPQPQDALNVIEEWPESIEEARNVIGALAVNRKGYNGSVWLSLD